MEALFGSPSPMWTTPMSYGFASAARDPAANLNTISSSLYAPANMVSSATPAGLAVNPALPFFANPLTLVNSDVSAGVPAAALLAAVAVRRGQPQGPANDQEVEDFLYDALELLPGTSDVEVRCDNGRATLAGTVHHKRIKRDVGEVAWAIPAVNDVQNNVTITSRRRARVAGGREVEAPATQNRK